MIFDSGYHIEVFEGLDRGKKFPLISRELTLGRKLIPNEKIANWILFNEPTVSRFHALLIWDDKSGAYELHHKSKTNPTLINSKLADRKKLHPGDSVQMGLLVFGIIKGMGSGSSSAGDGDSALFRDIPKGEPILHDQYVLTVIEGENRGEAYPLKTDLIMIGRRENDEGAMAPNEILLPDESIPREHLLLVWNVREGGYGIIKVESSKLISCLHRKKDALESVMDINSEKHMPLRAGDTLFIGNTVLRYHRKEEPADPPKLLRGASHSRKTKSPEKADGAHAAPRERERGAQGKKQDTLIVASDGRERSRKGSDTSADSGTIRWNINADYLLQVTEGADRGAVYYFLSSDLKEGRSITIGRKGLRVNDITFDDAAMDNTQAVIVYKKGKFYLKNEYTLVHLLINRDAVPLNQSVELRSGDHLEIGKTRLIFLDRRIQDHLRFYRLEVIEGERQDRGKSIGVSGEVIKIGRSGECDLQLSDREVSPVHSLLRFRENCFYLEQISELNPTLINGISMPQGAIRQLYPGDRIRLSSRSLISFVRE